MNKKDAKILCDLVNGRNDGFKYSLVKSAKCVNCYDIKKEKIEAKAPKKGLKNVESEANSGLAE